MSNEGGSGNYASDRFYLNHIPYEPFHALPKTPPQETEDDRNIRHCHQFFDRARYFQQVLQQEEIKCVVLSSYRLDWEVIQAQFAPCFQDASSIPLLVLHGEKRDGFEAFMSSLKGSSKRSAHLREEGLDLSEDEQEDQSYEASWKHKLWGKDITSSLACQVEVWEVLPQWVMDILPSNHPKRYIPGVHHPKYMLIFTSEGLHVNISTANLTVNGSVDACWIQFFPRQQSRQSDVNNDFGDVLEDFLCMQSKQLRCGDLAYAGCFEDLNHEGVTKDILQWIQSHVGSQSIAKDFDFSKASVELISSVPCRKPLPPLSQEEKRFLYQMYEFDMDLISSSPCDSCVLEAEKIRLGAHSEIVYGSKRIKALLEEQAKTYSRLSQKDWLYLQPTSIGIGLDNSYMGGLLEDYMPESIWDEDFEVLRSERWRMIWPSRDGMIDIHRRNCVSPSKEDTNNAELNSNVVQGILFFHPKSFALMETDIQTQFYTYAPTEADVISQVSKRYSPHIKSYCRLLDEDHVKQKQPQHGEEQKCSCYDVAWAMVTSACLSKGAQGVQCPYSICSTCRHIQQGYIEYRNFELGVLLKSTENKQYQALCGSCPIHGKKATSVAADEKDSNVERIVLPFPYDLYYESEAFCNDVGKVQIDLYYNPPASEGMKYASAYREDSEVLRRKSISPNSDLPSNDPSVVPTKLNKAGESTVLGRRSFSVLNVDNSLTKQSSLDQMTKAKSMNSLGGSNKKIFFSGKENENIEFSSFDSFQLVRNHTFHNVPVKLNPQIQQTVEVSQPMRVEDNIVLGGEYEVFTSTEVEDNDVTDDEGRSTKETNITQFMC